MIAARSLIFFVARCEQRDGRGDERRRAAAGGEDAWGTAARGTATRWTVARRSLARGTPAGRSMAARGLVDGRTAHGRVGHARRGSRAGQVRDGVRRDRVRGSGKPIWTKVRRYPLLFNSPLLRAHPPFSSSLPVTAEQGWGAGWTRRGRSCRADDARRTAVRLTMPRQCGGDREPPAWPAGHEFPKLHVFLGLYLRRNLARSNIHGSGLLCLLLLMIRFFPN